MPSSKTEILFVLQQKTNEVPEHPVGLGAAARAEACSDFFGASHIAVPLNQLERNRSQARSMADEAKLEELITALLQVALAACPEAQESLDGV